MKTKRFVMPATHLDHISRRAFVAAGASTLVAASMLSQPADATDDHQPMPESELTEDKLVKLVTSNQIEFRSNGGKLEPIIRCGPKVYLHEMSKYLRDAVVAVEDHRFFYHRGVDPNGLLRAGWRSLISMGRKLEGGSTITQQLIKNTVLNSDQSIGRKTTEWKLAWMLERAMSKPRILEAYLNQVVFEDRNGRLIVGVEQAARLYFGRTALDLSLFESAVLAGMLRKPHPRNPVRHPEAAREGAQDVLTKMIEQGIISEGEMALALITSRKKGQKKPIRSEMRSFVYWVLADIRSAVPSVNLDVGTRIPITLEIESQANAEAALKKATSAYVGNATENGYVTMGKDGQVVVLVGQRNYSLRQMNLATQAKRQPASTFKPFVYAAALEAGVVKPSRKLTEAMARSDNDEPRRLARLVGPGPVVDLARRLGIKSHIRTDASFALGTSEVTLLELTTAYVPFGNGGLAVRPYGYHGITSGGEIRYWTNPTPRRAIAAELAKAIHPMLRAVVLEGTGIAAKHVKDAAGKTGTSDGNRDAWFIGMTSRHVSGIWLGNPDNSAMPGVGGATAARIWARVEKALPNSEPNRSRGSVADKKDA
jgi:penicillin-binding protein 1A